MLAPMTYLALLVPGDRWWPDRATLDQGHPIEQHLTAMRRLRDDGLLVAGGTLLDGGAVALLRTSDEALARSVIEADPAVGIGLLRPRLEQVTDYASPCS